MSGHVCPWWIGYLMASPVRRLFEKPEQILNGYVGRGATVLDFGCAMGFFTLPAARMVGETGRVIAVDLQEKMIRSLNRRVRKAGLTDRVETRLCTESDLNIGDLADAIDVTLAIHVVHEVPSATGLLRALFAAAKPGGLLFLVEPNSEVKPEEFAATVEIAHETGFISADPLNVKWGRSHLLAKPAAPTG